MQTAHAIPLTSTSGDYKALTEETGTEASASRLRLRRRLIGFAAASHAINLILLATYAAAGTIPATIVVAFAGSAALVVAAFIAISESGLRDRGNDHHFGVPYAAATFLLMLAFIYIAPEVGVVFLCALFLGANVIALRASARQAAAIWAFMCLALAGLFFLPDLSISMPFGNNLERLATLLTFALTIARCMFIGVFASSLRDALYKRGVDLEAAYRRIEELAELDELTGSFNRRCIMRALNDEIVCHQRSKLPCSIALIDLDWFKRINDTYGHPTGDEVLRTFAIAMFANIRSTDKFGRYGGEEFLLVLPDTTQDSAKQIIERLRIIVATLDWTAFSDGLSVTFSAGIATLRSMETAEPLLARADSALYAAKECGRNRIASA